jgi:uncharacterized protein YndB with AHSA1/START domain
MASMEKDIRIAAPPADVFALIADPARLPAVWPSLVEVRDVTVNETGGSDFSWTYRMAGLKFDGHSTTTEYAPPTRLVSVGKGGIANTFTWTVTADGDGTALAVHVDYAIPGALLGKLAEPLIMRQNAKEMDEILANIKSTLER